MPDKRMDIYRMDSGRFIVAVWGEREAQYYGISRHQEREASYDYTYARTLGGLCALGVPTYATARAARAARARREERDLGMSWADYMAL